MRKESIAVVLALFFALGSCNTATLSPYMTREALWQYESEVIDQNLRTTVRVGKEVEGEKHGMGTGFLYKWTRNSKIIVVTAKHVVLDGDGKVEQNLYFWNSYIGGTYKCKVIHIDKSDMAVLESYDVAPFFGPQAHLESGVTKQGKPIAVLGMAENEHGLVDRGTIESRPSTRGEDEVYYVSGLIIPGFSGGPTIDLVTGKVVGIQLAIRIIQFNAFQEIRGPGILLTSQYISKVLSKPEKFTIPADNLPAE